MPENRQKTVFILGAGASADAGTPLTNEILWRAFCDPAVRADLERDSSRAHDLEEVQWCLTNHFHVPAEGATKEDFPSLTLLLSILDLSITRNRPFPASVKYPSGLSREQLAKARASLEYIIFAVLDHFLRRPTGHTQSDLLVSPLVDVAEGPQVISLNYDILMDTAMCRLAQTRRGDKGRLDYTCDIRTEPYNKRVPYGTLLKVHGSLNWLFCPGCQALQIGMSGGGDAIADSSMLRALYAYKALDKHYVCSAASCHVCQCEYCETPLRSVMITPSFVKEYNNNPHIHRVWYNAERLLRQCDRAYVIGYSLPDDDLEVIHMLRRGLEGLDSSRITVVTHSHDDAMYRRYVSLFGRDIVWKPIGFAEWISDCGYSQHMAVPAKA